MLKKKTEIVINKQVQDNKGLILNQLNNLKIKKMSWDRNIGFVALYIYWVRVSEVYSLPEQKVIGLSIGRECLSCDLRQHASTQILCLAGPRNDSGKDSIIFRVNAFRQKCLGRRDQASLCFLSPETGKNVWRSQQLWGILGFVFLGL